MEIGDPLQQLIGDVLALDWLHLSAFPEGAGEVGFDKLEDSIDVFGLLRRLAE
jgi:hypothetical protein